MQRKVWKDIPQPLLVSTSEKQDRRETDKAGILFFVFYIAVLFKSFTMSK